MGRIPSSVMGAKTALEQNLDYMSKTLKYQDVMMQ
jgi:hypothetical protein